MLQNKFYKKKSPTLFFFFLQISLLLILGSCKKEPIPIPSPPEIPTTPICEFISFKMDGAQCALDIFPKTFYYSIVDYEMNFAPLIEIETELLEIKINQNLITNNAVNDLGTVKVNEPLIVDFTFCDSSEVQYQIIFTRLPTIQITTQGQDILDNPKTPVGFRLNDPDYLAHGLSEREYISYSGLELRGGSAQSYPKKSFDLELWQDSLGTEKQDAELLEMRNDDDWVLDAMYIDQGRMRNRVSTDLWLDFHDLHYAAAEPKAKAATCGKLVELFIDDRYRGIYTLTERIDRKQLKLQDFEEGNNHGLLYKSVTWGNGAVTFDSYVNFDPMENDWDGWIQKYPDADAESLLWNPIAEFTQFVVESSDTDFENQIFQKIDHSSLVDYYIFLNLIRGDDNRGKNIYLAKYQQSEPFFFVPWDLDATWGRLWNGSITLTQGILSNGLFDRLLEMENEVFENDLKLRWTNARNNIFTKNSLMGYFENYAEVLERNGTFAREKEKWGMDNSLSEEMELIENWIEGRLDYLDDYFENL